MSTGLACRHVDGTPEDPVGSWPFEGIVAAVERGYLPHWHRLAEAIAADPWGPVARAVHEAVQLSRPYGTTELMEGVIAQAREEAARAERREVAAEIGRLVRQSGLGRGAFAERIGTSASRLSTYLAGTVTPSAALVCRMRRVAHRAAAGPRR